MDQHGLHNTNKPLILQDSHCAEGNAGCDSCATTCGGFWGSKEHGWPWGLVWAHGQRHAGGRLLHLAPHQGAVGAPRLYQVLVPPLLHHRALGHHPAHPIHTMSCCSSAVRQHQLQRHGKGRDGSKRPQTGVLAAGVKFIKSSQQAGAGGCRLACHCRLCQAGGANHAICG